MDARLPGLSGTEATAALRRQHPEARIDDDFHVQEGTREIYNALQAGAMAYLLKSVQREELLLAIRKAAIGKRHVPPELAERLAERLTRSQLSSRELDVLRLLVGGMRNRQIALALNIAEGTVKLHVSSVLAKLGVADRTEAVTVALQRGIVQLKN